MLDTLQRAEAIVRSGDAAPDELVRALTELGHFLDPEKTAPSPRSAQVFGRALDLMSDLKVEPDGPVLAEFLLSLAKYAYVAGHPLKGLAPSQLAVEVARRQNSRAQLRMALSIRGVLLADTGNLPVAIEMYAEAWEIAVELGDAYVEMAVCNNLGCALIYAAQYEDAIACLERVVALSEGKEALRESRAAALNNIALACLHLEDYARGLRAA
jgi:tetratricopeptide (TPR) repeat protein